MPKQLTPIEHKDRLGQPIKPGDYVAFSHSYTPGALLGRVVKLTKLKVRVEYMYKNWYKGQLYEGKGKHITDPANTIVLGDTLQQHILLEELKRK